MPVFFLDRLPLPNLKVYTAISVLLLSCSVYYAIQVTTQPGYSRNVTLVDIPNDLAKRSSIDALIDDPESSVHEDDVTVAADEYGAVGRPTVDVVNGITRPLSLADVLYYLVEEPLCIWTLINMAYCCLILIGKVIQKIVFGELRVSEQQHVKDKFWNFVFYKFIFIFGVMNVQFMDEVVLWCSWFSVLGFLHLLAQLCKDRFQYLSFSPTMPKWTHVRLLSLLVGILIMSSFLLTICVFVGLHAGVNTFAFMGAECVLLIVRTLFVIVRYAIHLWDMNHYGVWENRGTYIYYTELMFELSAAFIDLLHHTHMLLWSNIFLSMASLVICMQIRYLSYEIQRRFKKHKNYLRVIQHMEQNYPMGTTDELAANSDDCAICWDKMESARKLPCGHLFHNSCLQSWLEQDTSCPTCRTSLADPTEINRRSQNNVSGRGEADRLETLEADRLPGTPNATATRANRTTTNHFFHFDASRYVSWLPSFSVEVTHTQLLHRQTQMQTSQLDNMVWQVQQLFPQMPLNTIRDDLRTTRSVDATVDNILEERLVAPPFQMQGARTAMNSHEIPQVSQQANQALDLLRGNSEASNVVSLNTVQEALMASLSPDVNEVVGGEVAATAMAAEQPHTRPKIEVANVNLSEPFFVAGGRFSKSSQERERMLANRKDELVRQAKKRYMSKLISGESSSDGGQQQAEDDGQSEVSVDGDAESRRCRAYQAACRRLKRDEEDT